MDDIQLLLCWKRLQVQVHGLLVQQLVGLSVFGLQAKEACQGMVHKGRIGGGKANAFQLLSDGPKPPFVVDEQQHKRNKCSAILGSTENGFHRMGR